MPCKLPPSAVRAVLITALPVAGIGVSSATGGKTAVMTLPELGMRQCPHADAGQEQPEDRESVAKLNRTKRVAQGASLTGPVEVVQVIQVGVSLPMLRQGSLRSPSTQQ
jgi:hypothetical protein